MKSNKKSKKKKENIEEEMERQERLGLSDEAKLSPKQKKQMEKLDENRFLISTEPKEEEKEEVSTKEKKSLAPQDMQPELKKDKEDLEKSEKIKEKKEKQGNPIKEPRNLVKLLSTYKVSLNSPVKKLIKKIKKKGKDHLEEELKNLE